MHMHHLPSLALPCLRGPLPYLPHPLSKFKKSHFPLLTSPFSHPPSPFLKSSPSPSLPANALTHSLTHSLPSPAKTIESPFKRTSYNSGDGDGDGHRKSKQIQFERANVSLIHSPIHHPSQSLNQYIPTVDRMHISWLRYNHSSITQSQSIFTSRPVSTSGL